MSETITIALITFLSGITGAIIGVITAYQVAKFSSLESKRQLAYTEKQRIYSALLDAYNSYIAMLTASTVDDKTGFPDENERLLYTHFQSAYSQAVLVSSDTVAKSLTALLIGVNKFGKTLVPPENLNMLYNAAIHEMQKELALLCK